LGHSFFVPRESKRDSIERLRRQLEWLRCAYNPISVPQLLQKLEQGTVPDRAVVVTTDDALLDVYEVSEEFKSFGVPLAVFVCVGWVQSEGESAPERLIEAVTALHWYNGPDSKVDLGNGLSFELTASKKPAIIDCILEERETIEPYLSTLCAKISALKEPGLHRSVCNWRELRELAASGVHIGAHSVSHVRISQMSAIRQDFEIKESKRTIDTKIGQCISFAYPYGVQGTYNEATLAQVKEAGFRCAFLSHSDFVTTRDDAFELPRISIPGGDMPLYEFKARVRGGGIPLRKLKEGLTRFSSKKADQFAQS
jgi:peptidoglycan/xylan/chitin deacetylase (PgdA/CDA1 family)